MGNVYKKSEILQELMEDTIRKYPEMEPLKQVRIVCLAKDKPNRRESRTVYADCMKVTDKYKAVTNCDFIITFYADALKLDVEKQERLMYHELLHVGYDPDDGRCFVVPHDLEDFRAVIKRWGIDWIHDNEKKTPPREKAAEEGEKELNADSE